MRSQGSKNTVGEQLSLFGLPRTKNMIGGMRTLAELREIQTPPKQFIQYGKDQKDD
jgi:hypothetical protein